MDPLNRGDKQLLEGSMGTNNQYNLNQQSFGLASLQPQNNTGIQE